MTQAVCKNLSYKDIKITHLQFITLFKLFEAKEEFIKNNYGKDNSEDDYPFVASYDLFAKMQKEGYKASSFAFYSLLKRLSEEVKNKGNSNREKLVQHRFSSNPDIQRFKNGSCQYKQLFEYSEYRITKEGEKQIMLTLEWYSKMDLKTLEVMGEK